MQTAPLGTARLGGNAGWDLGKDKGLSADGWARQKWHVAESRNSLTPGSRKERKPGQRPANRMQPEPEEGSDGPLDTCLVQNLCSEAMDKDKMRLPQLQPCIFAPRYPSDPELEGPSPPEGGL